MYMAMSVERSARAGRADESQSGGVTAPGDLPFRWRGGNTALDFANTAGWAVDEVTGRTEVQLAEFERFTRYERVVAWAREADVLPEREAAQILAAAAEQPAEAEQALERALVLRLAVHRLFSAVARGDELDRPALTTVNALLPAAHAAARVTLDEGGFGWTWDEGEVSLDRPIWPVVVAAHQLLTSEALASVRECPGNRCGWLFVDRSPAGNRRWCAIEDCGNRERNERRRGEMPAETAQAVAEERRRLSRELHDSVSQALFSIGLGAKTARALLERDPAQVAEPLDYVLAQAELGLAEMRALIFDLRPEALAREGLAAALERQAAALEARYRVECRLVLEGEPKARLTVKEALYRIAQEALHNTVKHARASAVRVHLAHSPAQIVLEIEDNGLGFDAAGSYPGHLGLHSMHERAAQVGGRLTIESTPGEGTLVRVTVPRRRSR
jgi:signal transduction histidine kinase